MNSVIRIQKDGAGAAGLEPCSVIPAEAVLSGSTDEVGEVHFEAGSGNVTVGTWQCTPYAEKFSCPDFHEYSIILEGSVALTNPDGTVEVFEAGESYVLPVGWEGRFEVLETLRKIYVITAA